MRIIPVIDWMGGIVVRAVAGRRHEYQAIQSPLVDSPEPLHVARRLLEASGASQLYVADLDAITSGNSVANSVWEFLSKVGVEVFFDGGFRDSLPSWPSTCRIRPVFASECISPTDHPAAISSPSKPVFSLDLRAGEVISGTNWNPIELATAAVDAGFQTLIVLDLTRVGTNSGTGTLDLIASLRQRFPELELIAGGGIRNSADLARLESAGANAALIASALHDGRIRGT